MIACVLSVLRRSVLVLACVTALPIAKSKQVEGDISGLSKYLPVAGLAIGVLLSAAAYLLALLKCPSLLSGVLMTILWLAATGGMHFEGLMDTFDGICSLTSRERMLQIMSDSRVGNFGAMAGFATFAAKAAALSSLPSPVIIEAVLFITMWGRWCQTYAIGKFPYLRAAGLGKVWHETTRFPRDILLSAILPLTLTVVAGLYGLLFPVLSAILTVTGGIVTAHWLNRILEGHTGDTYGATLEIAETAALVVTAILMNRL